MPKGRPSKWVTVKIKEEFQLGKKWLRVEICDKHGRTRRGYCYVNVGGLRWQPYQGKRTYRLSWDKLEKAALA